MEEDQYVYAVTRIHIHEQYLLNKTELDALAEAADMPAALSVLSGKGWDAALSGDEGFDALIASEYEKIWAFVAELGIDASSFDVFRRQRDFHNLKAALKLSYSNETIDERRYFMPFGSVETGVIVKAVREREFSRLPDDLAKAGKEALEILLNTGNGQLCEISVDSAALVAVWAAGVASKHPLLRKYAEIIVDTANINSAARLALLGKSREFAERVVAPAGTLDRNSLIEAAAGSGPDSLAKLLGPTEYSAAIETLGDSAAFDKWKNDELIRLIRPQRSRISGLEPVAAFILARENEIRLVRLALSARQSGLSSKLLKERMGLTYV